MRTLLYVPIIHTSADLGSLAGDVEKRGLEKFGESAWTEHLRSIDGFWEALARYFEAIPVSANRIFQDGMITDGEMGLRIIREVAKAGSKNHRLVASLLERGALLMKTEDFALVKRERDLLLALVRSKTAARKILSVIRYKLAKKNLLRMRDIYIGQRINQTLQDGETGILFIGAYHRVEPGLSGDIRIQEIKELRKIREYQSLLLHYPKDKGRFEELSRYLISPIA